MLKAENFSYAGQWEKGACVKTSEAKQNFPNFYSGWTTRGLIAEDKRVAMKASLITGEQMSCALSKVGGWYYVGFLIYLCTCGDFWEKAAVVLKKSKIERFMTRWT